MHFGKGFILFFVTAILFFQYLPAAATQAGDTMQFPASLQYSNPSLLNRILLGKNYRKDWRTPVSLPVFNLKAAGLTITELGGGMQTKSLYFKDKHKQEWVLRTVDKDPREALPKPYRNHFTQKVMQQMISAAYPYGAMMIPTLAKATGVQTTTPVYYFVPDDAAFGKYREIFANTICLFERKDVTPADVPVIETEDVVANGAYHVDQSVYLKARLLDMLIGDWDRHADNWVWAVKKGGRFEALPKDRDQAFFHSRGLLVKAVQSVAMKHLVGFASNTRCVKQLNFKSWNMDRLFTCGLNDKDWESMVRRFCSSLTDEVIDSAVGKLPKEAYAISGETLRRKLKARRDGMVKDVMRYYKFVAREVVIDGTDAAETVRITGNKDSVTIDVEGKYHRTFYSKETKVINMYLLGGDDQVKCDAANIGIEIRIDDGKGKDTHELCSNKSITIAESDMDIKAREKELRAYLKIKD